MSLSSIHHDIFKSGLNSWLVGRLTPLFGTKIGYIREKVLGGDLVPPGSKPPTSLPFCSATTWNGKG